MRICIVGAGAIGGYLAVRLIKAGAEVSLIVRGANLEAIRRDGLVLEHSDGTVETAHPALATADTAAAGPHDLVIIAVKTLSLAGLAPTLRPLYHAETAVVPAQNGIPWWYFHGVEGEFAGRRIEAVDPDGAIEANIETGRVIGCVVYPAAELLRPGVVRHIENNRFTLGEPDGTKSARVTALAELFGQAGLRGRTSTRIRNEIWVKLWGNLAFNPISALTRATLDVIIGYQPTHELARNMMLEAQAIGERLGIDFGISVDKRIAGAREIGAHKTSMLQDIEAGRPTEIDALVGAVAELGRLTGLATPHIDAVYASVRLLERTVGR